MENSISHSIVEPAFQGRTLVLFVLFTSFCSLRQGYHPISIYLHHVIFILICESLSCIYLVHPCKKVLINKPPLLV